MRIIFKAKAVIATFKFGYSPSNEDEKGTRATKKRNVPFIFENFVSIFLAKTEAIR